MLEPSDMPSGLNLADAMEKLMAHPEIIELAASVLKPEERDDQPSSEAKPSDDGSPPTESESAAPVSAHVGNATHARKQHNEKAIDGSMALLIALKPYLSKKRCETIDRLIEFGKIGRVLFELQ